MDLDSTELDRKRRKEEGRRRKRERIAESGGKRPRQHVAPSISVDANGSAKAQQKKQTSSSHQKHYKSLQQRHQFGRVMESVPCRNKPRLTTLSIAIPGSVLTNCQTKELRTQLVGQIARAATIYHVDEIIVFDDKLSKDIKDNHYGSYRKQRRERDHAAETHTQQTSETPGHPRTPFDPHGFMAKILQYCECPQYLRRHFFPMHPDLQFAGLLSPIDAPHHVRAEDRCKYREGVVLDKLGPNKKSLVHCGIRGRPVEIDVTLQAGVRCTVELDPSAYESKNKIQGRVVAPAAPREDNGMYWGYTVRMADSLKAALEECPYEGGYDLKIGTSERGSVNLDDRGFSLPPYKHSLIVFGGVAGIEECVDADESFKLPGSESRKLFDQWVNICQYQGSRTIRTEEAVLIALAKMSPFLGQVNKEGSQKLDGEHIKDEKGSAESCPPKPVEFSDAPSEESSESDSDS